MSKAAGGPGFRHRSTGDDEVRPDAPVQVDWEHTEARWVRPEEVFAFDTVPQLAEALTRVYPLRRP